VKHLTFYPFRDLSQRSKARNRLQQERALRACAEKGAPRWLAHEAGSTAASPFGSGETADNFRLPVYTLYVNDSEID